MDWQAWRKAWETSAPAIAGAFLFGLFDLSQSGERPSVEEGPGRRGILDRGLAFSQGIRGALGGTPLNIISAVVFRSNQAKGAQ
jgi:hypothetical protein